MHHAPASSLPAIFRTLLYSLQQRVCAANYCHILNPNASWDTLVEETEGRCISREDRARGAACFIKPNYSSYVDLLILTLSNSTPSSRHSSTHSGQDEDPLDELIQELGIERIQWDEIELTQADLDKELNEFNFIVPSNNNDVPTPPATPAHIIIQIPGQEPSIVPQHHEIQVLADNQLLVDAEFPHTLSGCIGSALAWHSEGRTFAAH